MRVFYYKNEGPFCGCWSDAYVIATDTATEELNAVLEVVAEGLTERTYELNMDENEYDQNEDEEAYLERDEEIAIESSCGPSDFEEIDPSDTLNYTTIGEYGIGEWNKNKTVWFYYCGE